MAGTGKADLLGGELGELRETVHEATRGVTDKFDRSFWLECAREHRFPDEIWTAMVDQGLLGLGVPIEYVPPDEDREIVLYDVSPYSMFNEAAVFDEGKAEVTVIARGDVDTVEVPAAFIRQLIVRSPEVAAGCARYFAQRQRRLTGTACKPAFRRVLPRAAPSMRTAASDGVLST